MKLSGIPESEQLTFFLNAHILSLNDVKKEFRPRVILSRGSHVSLKIGAAHWRVVRWIAAQSIRSPASTHVPVPHFAPPHAAAELRTCLARP
jgi:hypothetical protein